MTSIIILSYNTLPLTRLCIESIRTYTEPGTYEILVVDNASKDGSREWLEGEEDIRLIANEKNEGFPRGCNQGLHIAKGNALLLLNSDTIVTPNWLTNMLTALYSAEDIGAVSCVTNSCSNLQKIPVNYDSLEEMESFAEAYNVSDPAKWFPWKKLVGFCFLMKREAYERVGDLDEAFYPGNYEDDDLSVRLRLAGYDLLLCQDTFIHHFGSASFIKNRTPEEQQQHVQKYNALLERNERYFLEKWKLTKRYGAPFTLTPPLSPGMQATIIDCGYGEELCFLHARHPEAVLTGIALSEESARLISPRFPIRQAASLEEAIGAVPPGQDFVFLLKPIPEPSEAHRLVLALAPRMKAGGTMLWYDGRNFFSATKEGAAP